MSDKSLYTVSLKGARQQDPWIVVNADTANELAQALSDLAENGLYQQVTDANGLFAGSQNAAPLTNSLPSGSSFGGGDRANAPAQPAQQAAAPVVPQQRASGGYGRRKGSGGSGGSRQAVPAGVIPEPCHHGDRVNRSGTSARGPWEGWMCPAPKGTPDQCDPVWVQD